VTSGDSEHVVGAVASKDDHRVYLWSRLYGKLDKILEGGDELAGSIAHFHLASRDRCIEERQCCSSRGI
jgi:hypothetical protein